MMEDNKTLGVYFNEDLVRKIVEDCMEWTEVAADQVFCATDIMNTSTPIGTSIMVTVDGIKCSAGSDTVFLILSSGSYELPVKTVNRNDEMLTRFNHAIPVPGTYGQLENGELDILTDEEKAFKKAVENFLGDRDDNYAEMFRKDNIRNVGGRGLILLEKMKAEIKDDKILSGNSISPTVLIAAFIEITDKYIQSKRNISECTKTLEKLEQEYTAIEDEDSKQAKKLTRDLKMLQDALDTNKNIEEFCLRTIESAVIPVMNSNVEC